MPREAIIRRVGMMRIGELASRANVTARTVRYYESFGVIPRGERQGSGQHRYPEKTLARLQKVDQLKALGLTLEEIREVMPLYFEEATARRAKKKVLAILHRHLTETDAHLKTLTEFRQELVNHIERFRSWLNNES